jgi:hypothetical protein
MPSAGHVVALDLEQVSLNLDLVTLDEALDFRAQHREAYTAYRRDLQRVLWELASIDDIVEREHVLLQRRQDSQMLLMISSAKIAEHSGRTWRAGRLVSPTRSGPLWAATL